MWDLDIEIPNKLANETKFNFKTSTSVSIYDPKISSNIYLDYFNTNEKLFNDFDLTYIINLSFDINPHELLNPKDITHTKSNDKAFRTEIIKESKKAYSGKTRKFQVSYWLGEKINRSILFYEPLSQNYLKYWEIVKKFDLLSGIEDNNYLEVGTHPGFLEVIHQATLGVNQVNLDYIWLKYSIENAPHQFKKNISDIIDIYKWMLPINMSIQEKHFSFDDLLSKNKYDLISLAPSFNVSEFVLPDTWELVNAQITFSSLLLGIFSQSNNGNLILVLPEIKTVLVSQFVMLLSIYYQNVVLYRPEIILQFKQIGITIIAKGFKGITKNDQDQLLNIHQKWSKLDPSGGNNFNIIDSKLRKKYLINKPINKLTNKNPKFVSRFLDNPKLEKIVVQKINLFNQTHYQNIINYIEKMLEYDTMFKNNVNIKSQLKEKQLYYSVIWAKIYDLEVKPNLRDNVFFDDYGRHLIRDMYSPAETINFKFQKYKNLPLPEINYKIYKSLEIFTDLSKIHYQSASVIDTRDLDLYTEVKNKIKFYRKTLDKLLYKDYNAEYVSQAWMKMYEILETFKLVSTKKKTIKTFHMCEFPGSFIIATNHYLKTKTECENFDWYAQSLNPMYDDDITALKDQYGLADYFPKRFIYGHDNTGDIRNPDNIRSYGKYCENIDLMTSDCGLSWSEKSCVASELAFSQALFILANLPNGGNVVYKLYLPYNRPILISTLYLMYLHFDEFYFYKPFQNPQSEEYYVIGKNYHSAPKSLINKLYAILDDNKFDQDKSLFDPKLIPEKFLVQLENVGSQLVNNFKLAINRVIYYVDNYHFISNKNWLDMDEIIHERNKQWIKKYKPKRLDQIDKIKRYENKL